MASTSVHLPDQLLHDLDRLAAERGSSRNRLIVESCLRLVEDQRRWPEGFFSNHHLSADDLAELQRGAAELDAAIAAGRRSRTAPPF